MNNSRPQQPLPQLHGVLVLDKPKGPTSARCLTAIKRLGQKKIGHAGTLDPMATGVLLVLLGHATKISGYLLDGGEKVYAGALCLGQSTDTWDAEGRITATAPWQHITEARVRDEIALWQGRHMQPVPAYAAAKHEGKPLYTLARSGKVTPEKAKEVAISCAELVSVALPCVRFRVRCSSGTYIRSLAHSLGTRLGCGAVLTQLTRQYSHPFGLDEAHTLDDILAAPESLPARLLPVSAALPHWPCVAVTEQEQIPLCNGKPIPCTGPWAAGHEGVRVFLLSSQGAPLALAQCTQDRAGAVWTILRGLWH